jgi:hypothetical protein
MFEYRPKFVDIRVRPPKPGESEADARAAEEDVFKLKPGERPCDHAECRLAATAKAPKSRTMPGEFYWFCQKHAAEYNKGWDFFQGMSEGEMRAAMESSQAGDRPTWSFKADSRSREAAAAAARDKRAFNDPFGVFKAAQRKAEAAAEAGRTVGRLERNALADLDLEPGAAPEAVRAQYKALLKRFHPDTNGGDRSTEQKQQRVVKAYKTLQKAKLA